MSCITEILKIKGDRAILPILRDEKVGKAVVIEGGGHWLGFEYLITFTDLGHRCGYVAIPPGHVADKEHDRREDWDIDCHGGVTFINRKHSAKTLLGENACTD
ncbi:MAG TPA: hypothetical protein VK588_11335, partial [Chitinophagaceae bacterium]|nr:hypothetical protein [Chitinophagaceae bacterium]